MSTVGLSDIPYDVLVLFFTHLEGDRNALYASCLASRVLREAAQESLYRHVQLDYYSKENTSYSALETLRRRPHLRPYVRSIDLVLHVYQPHVQFGTSVAVLSSLPGLQSFTLRFYDRHRRTRIPFFFPTVVWKDVVPHLQACTTLRSLHILFRVAEEDVPEIKEIPSLRSLALGSPSVSFLDGFQKQLASWTSLQIPDSSSLHHASFPLAPSLTRLDIGSGHCLTRDDLFCLLTRTPALRVLKIFYDNFASYAAVPSDTPIPSLQLEYLIVRHQGVASRPTYNDLFKWIRLVAPTSLGKLRVLGIIADDDRSCPPSWTAPLVEYIKAQQNLKVLCTPAIGFKQSDFDMMLLMPSIRILAQAYDNIHYRIRKGALEALYVHSSSVNAQLTAEVGLIRHIGTRGSGLCTVWTADAREVQDPLEVELLLSD